MIKFTVLSRQIRLSPVLLFALGLYLLVVLMNAWVADDAYITLRSVYHFTHGFGPVYNVAERVQSYTHPLWMLLLSGLYLITDEAYVTTLVLSVATSLAAVSVLIWGVASSWRQALVGVLLLIVSKAFMDYSTSGLENPMTHLLLALFYWQYLTKPLTERRFFWLCLLACLALLNRMDTALFYAPPLLVAVFRLRTWKVIPLGLAAFAPFILWEFFSLFYYGFPFPNTAYAKLNHRIPSWGLVQQGWWYLQDSVENDPVLLVTVLFSSVLMLVYRGKVLFPLLIGNLLYLLYILKVGGDFMSGRFLTGVFFTSVLGLTWLVPRHSWVRYSWFAVVIAGLFNPLAPVYTTPDYQKGTDWWSMIRSKTGIVDERGFYFDETGLISIPGAAFSMEADLDSVSQDTLIQRGAIGFLGYRSGPNAHVLDDMALADPLLARLPPLYNPRWRPGHLLRLVPTGYVATLETGENQLADSQLAEYYEHLNLITRGPLLSKERLETIVRMNLGQYDHLIRADAYWHGPVKEVDAAQLAEPMEEGTWWQYWRATIVHPEEGTVVNFQDVVQADSLTVAADFNDRYRLQFLLQGEDVGVAFIDPTTRIESGMQTVRLALPEQTRKLGFDQVRVTAEGEDQMYSIGHLIPF